MKELLELMEKYNHLSLESTKNIIRRKENIRNPEYKLNDKFDRDLLTREYAKRDCYDQIYTDLRDLLKGGR